MTKKSGLAQNFYLGGYNLSGDTGAGNEIGGGLAGTQDVTGIDKSAYERVGLLRDGRLSWTSFFNPAAAAAHPVLSALRRQTGTRCGRPRPASARRRRAWWANKSTTTRPGPRTVR
jgi:hypothetical protein